LWRPTTSMQSIEQPQASTPFMLRFERGASPPPNEPRQELDALVAVDAVSRGGSAYDATASIDLSEGGFMEPDSQKAAADPSADGGETAAQSPTKGRLSIWTLAWVFLKVGATGFGDTGPLLALVERELVEDRRALTRDDITESLTYTRLLPGSTVVQIVSYLAYKLAGWPGSAIATVAYTLPSAVIMALLAAGYLAATSLPSIGPAVTGLIGAVVGVLLATAYRIGKRNIDLKQPVTIVIAVLAFAAGALFGDNAALIAVVGGALGVLFLAPRMPAADPATG
jgi:chromate transport protein ChrA